MCQAWQSYGLWFLVLAALTLGLIVGVAIGWRLRIAKQWWTGVLLHWRHISPAFRVAGYALAIPMVGVFIVYKWFFH